MAIAGRWLGQHLNRPGFPMFDYDVYALGGDGCMMEGISHEAASLAGHLELSNLCWIYDNNHITIEGNTALAFSDDVATRFLGYGWNVTRVGDANDLDMLERAFRRFKDTTDRPTLIIVDSHIGYGAPNKQDTTRRARRAARRGGDPPHQEELRLAGGREVPRPRRRARALPGAARPARRAPPARPGWRSSTSTRRSIPESADHILMMQHRELPAGWDKELAPFPADPKGLATRDSSGKVLNAVAQTVPWLIGGAADLVPVDEDAAHLRGRGRFRGRTYAGRNFHFGIREHAMGAICNGMSLSKVRPFGAGFFIFSDYARGSHPAVRADGAAGHLHLHPRLDRRRRGRPDAPADRAARLAARDART